MLAGERRCTTLVTSIGDERAASSGCEPAPRPTSRVDEAHASDVPSSAAGHRGAEVLRRDGLRVERRRPAGRAGSPGSCRTARSARRGRRRSAAPPGPSRRAPLMWSQIAAWAPTSTPRVGWAAISSTGSPLISRPTMSFCWLPPDSARAWCRCPGVRTSYSLDDALGVLAGAARGRSRSPWTLRRPGLVAEDPVLPQRRVEQQAVAVPVLGDVADAGLAALAGVPAGDVLAAEADRARWRACACP